MGNRTFNVIVVLFWLSTMTWLLIAKVTPLLRTGDPPAAQRQLVERRRDKPPVCWDMYWDERQIGWAATKVLSRDENRSDIVSRVQFERDALDEVPALLRRAIHSMLGGTFRFEMGIHSRMRLDADNQLQGFESAVLFDDFTDPLFTVRGELAGEKLELSLHSGNELVHQQTMNVGRAMVGDEFSPQTFMPNLYQGRTWTEQVYSPLPSPTSPGRVVSRIIEAEVERVDPIVWNDAVLDTWLVVYRDASAGTGGSSRPVGRMWVRRDGQVVRQEISVLGCRLRFERLTEEAARPMAEQLERDWSGSVEAEIPSE